jgi:glutamate formiminotransferase
VDAAVAAAAKAVELVNLNVHRGVHPRLGALDVLPFVPLRGASLEECVVLAHEAGQRIWDELRVPIYFYEAAAKRPERIRLEQVRRGQFEGVRNAVLNDTERAPDVGGPELHPTAGAVIVGARNILVAFNINLRTADVEVAKRIAKTVRGSSGGLPHVKAMGVPLASRGMVQVSMNLTDYEISPVHVVYERVRQLAAAEGVEIAEAELIGLVPRRALEMAFGGLLKLRHFDSQRVIENGLDSVMKL